MYNASSKQKEVAERGKLVIMLAETMVTEVRLFHVTFGQILCDGAWHYLFSPANGVVCDRIGSCDKETCKEGDIEEVRGDNHEIPESFLVELGLRILRPEDTVYIHQDEVGDIVLTTGYSILPDDPDEKRPLLKGGYLDLTDESGGKYRVINPYGYWATLLTLKEVLSIERTLTSQYRVPLRLVQALYLSGTSLSMIEPILKWATEAHETLRKKKTTLHETALQNLLRDPFSYKLRKELGLPAEWEFGFRDREIQSAVWTLGQLMGAEDS